jgi:hypothetical protein
MTLSTRRLGVLSALVQLLAIAVYGVLLIHQHTVPSDEMGNRLLAISVRMALGAAVLAFVGLFVDKQKILALVSLLATVPILLCMAGWQGIW